MMRKILFSILCGFTLVACDESGNTNSDSSNQPSDPKKGKVKSVKVPDEAFFKDYAYPGGKPVDVLNMGAVTSVFFETKDDYKKVTDFYTEKFKEGTSAVQDKTSYFGLPSAKPPVTVTVTRQKDGTTKIILRRE